MPPAVLTPAPATSKYRLLSAATNYADISAKHADQHPTIAFAQQVKKRCRMRDTLRSSPLSQQLLDPFTLFSNGVSMSLIAVLRSHLSKLDCRQCRSATCARQSAAVVKNTDIGLHVPDASTAWHYRGSRAIKRRHVQILDRRLQSSHRRQSIALHYTSARHERGLLAGTASDDQMHLSLRDEPRASLTFSSDFFHLIACYSRYFDQGSSSGYMYGSGTESS